MVAGKSSSATLSDSREGLDGGRFSGMDPTSGAGHLDEVATLHGCEACGIRDMALCSALDDDELEALEAVVVHTSLEAGKTLFYEGDEARHVFNVSSGGIRLHKLLADGRRQITGFMLPGDYLGLTAPSGYAYSAEAIVDTNLCRFPLRGLNRLLDRFPKLERRLLGMTRDELAAAQEQMLLLGRKTPVEKLSSFLLVLAAREERYGGSPDSVYLPMSRSDIADYLGLTVETVSRTIGRLKSERVIALSSSNTVLFKDSERLKHLAAGD